MLDKRIYRDLEGGWADLFNRIKWDVVKSIVKSAMGFQKSKVKVRSGSSSSQKVACCWLHILIASVECNTSGLNACHCCLDPI